MTAGMTGLRTKELKQIEVRDLHLDADEPFVEARASTTKNGKEAKLPLHPDVVACLRPLLASCARPTDRVFVGLVPRAHEFYKDLQAAGILQTAPDGKVVHFHSLRYTFATMLALNGVQPRVVMELMRHSDQRLTNKVYTDAGMLPLGESVRNLPSVIPSQETWTPIGTPAVVFEGPAQSTPVTIQNWVNRVATPVKWATGPLLSLLVHSSPMG